MKIQGRRIVVLVVSLAFFCGCQSTGVVQVSDNVYKISLKSAGGMFADEVKMRDEVAQQANEFAASKSKVAVEIVTNSHRPIALGLPEVEYVFKLVNKSDVESNGEGDLYIKILRLDELRKKGLISDAEFEAQKQKLLAGSN
jgi:hypothetical protein